MFTVPTGTPGGVGFSSVTTIPATWFNYISNNFPKIVDGIGGGYYQLVGANLRICSDTRVVKFNQPASGFPLELRGYVTIATADEADYATGVGGLTVSVASTFSAAVTYSGTTTFSNPVTFTADGDITMQSGCSIAGSPLLASGATLTVEGTVNVASGGSLTTASGSTATFTGNLTANGTATTISSTSLTISSVTSRSGSLQITGSNAVTQWRQTAINAASATATISTTADFWYVQSPAASSVYTLQSTPQPAEGTVIEFAAYSIAGGNTVDIRREDTSSVVQFGPGFAGAKFRCVSGVWRLVSASGTAVTIGSA